MKLTILQQLNRLFILSRWRRWLFPFLLTIPYVSSIIWLVSMNYVWVAQVLCAPLIMGVILAGVTIWLAREEFTR